MTSKCSSASPKQENNPSLFWVCAQRVAKSISDTPEKVTLGTDGLGGWLAFIILGSVSIIAG